MTSRNRNRLVYFKVSRNFVESSGVGRPGGSEVEMELVRKERGVGS